MGKVRQMIYCDLICVKDNYAQYEYSSGKGSKGVIAFPLKMVKPYKIEKQPEIQVADMWINKLFAKYIVDFQRGVAKEKISYEC